MTLVNTANKIFLNGVEVDKLMLGSTQIYAKSAPPAGSVDFVARTSGTTGASTSATITSPDGLVDDILIMALGGSRSSVVTSTGMSGWTKIFEDSIVIGGSAGVLSVYAKKATTTSESAVTWTGVSNTTKAWIVERYRGAAGLPTTTTPRASSGSASYALSSNPITPTVAGSKIITYVGGRGATSTDVPTWGGGAVGHSVAESGVAGIIFSAIQTKNSGETIHTAAGTNLQGAPVTLIGSVLLVPA